MSKLINYSLMALVMLVIPSVSAMEENQPSKKQKKVHVLGRVRQKRGREDSRKDKKRTRKAQKKAYSLATASLLFSPGDPIDMATLTHLASSLSIAGGEICKPGIPYVKGVKRSKISSITDNCTINPISAKRQRQADKGSLKKRRLVKYELSSEEDEESADDVQRDLGDLLALVEKRHEERDRSEQDEEEEEDSGDEGGTKRRTYDSLAASDRPNKIVALDDEEEEEGGDEPTGSIKRKRY